MKNLIFLQRTRYWEEVNIAVFVLAVFFIIVEGLFVYFLVKDFRNRQKLQA